MLLRLSFPDIENLPFPGYESEEDLKHPAGDEHNLPWQEAKNFSGKPMPKVLAPGTIIYRVIGSNKANGPYWVYELPRGLREWREGAAVKEAWNSNGVYVKYMVGNKGLPAWEGTAASQNFEKEGASEWMYPGGETQLFIPSSFKVIPEELPPYKTPWSQ